MSESDEGIARSESGAIEGELLEPGALPVTTRPPGRKPVAPLHVIPPLSAEEISILAADPNELLRRRASDYLTWAHNLISASPSKLNRVAWAIESQRRMAEKLLSLAIPPARTAMELGESRASSDAELLEILRSLGPDPQALTNREDVPAHGAAEGNR
jgi:hypothetical protein